MFCVVIGASGGIGRVMGQQLLDGGHTVLALSRSEGDLSGDRLTTGHLDLNNETSIEQAAYLAARIGAPDLVIIATGILAPDGQRPEKSSRQQGLDAFQSVFAINTFGPALIAKHFLPIMPRQGRAVFAALSARVGSISDNQLGGWHAYRASKAALNMLIRNYAVEYKLRNPDLIIASLHPGTVDTRLSKPYQKGVPNAKLFSPQQAAKALLAVTETLTPDQSGRVFDWAGLEILP